MTVDFAFLDSGTGGIPYMTDLKQKCPDAKCIYLGDTKNFPYGQKSAEQIIECATWAVKTIIDKWKPKAVVIACNTISVTALDSLRKTFDKTPIVGTVPAIKLASTVSKNRCIGFLATNATVNHPYSKKLIKDFASDCTVISRGDPDLVEFIEKSYFTSSYDEKVNAIKSSVDFFKAKGCDTIILGCTHFTHVADTMAKYAGPDINIIDSRNGVSKQAIKVEQYCRQNADEVDCIKDMSFFVTKATEEEIKEYQILCKNCNIPWGGII